MRNNATLFLFKMLFKYGISILYFLIKLFNCEFSDKSEMQLRYDACYKLVQIKAELEHSHLKELSQDLSSEEINNILQYTLFECYQNIIYYDAEEVDSKDAKDIDIYQDNYNELLNFEKWEELLKNKDENRIQYALMDIQKAYRDIQSGAIKVNRYQKKKPQNQKKTNDDEYFQRDENEQYIPRDMDGDFEIFGMNFSKLSPNIKNFIGFSLLILVFVCIFIGLNWIQKIRGENNKNKKKKNKKEKKN